jgi:hypothetical protein
MSPPGLRSVNEPDCCGNCRFLRWGSQQGWDKCGKHNFGVDWGCKRKQVCNDHERSNAEDPRVKKDPR